MRLILLGPPGSGKGTQAQKLCQRLGLLHISTGDILREAKKKGTDAGKRAQAFMDSGRLVPDDLVNDIIAERFGQKDLQTGFIVDGYPRTRAQADTFEQLLRRLDFTLDAVVSLVVPDEEIVRRLSGRRVCPQCTATYHVEHKPPKKRGVCDACQTPLIQRDDDKEETIRNRLTVYHQKTADLVDYYRQRGLLREVKGQGDIEAIHHQILEALRVKVS